MFNIYLICAEFEGRRLYKIGYTRREVSKRIKELKTGNGSELYVINSFSKTFNRSSFSSMTAGSNPNLPSNFLKDNIFLIEKIIIYVQEIFIL